jgi:hypothetical protein
VKSNLLPHSVPLSVHSFVSPDSKQIQLYDSGRGSSITSSASPAMNMFGIVII